MSSIDSDVKIEDAYCVCIIIKAFPIAGVSELKLQKDLAQLLVDRI
jgi:hypothetical protein